MTEGPRPPRRSLCSLTHLTRPDTRRAHWLLTRAARAPRVLRACCVLICRPVHRQTRGADLCTDRPVAVVAQTLTAP